MADGGTPPRSDPRNFGHAVPWAVVSDVRRRIAATRESLSEKGLQASSARLWPEGTVIVTTGATIGEVGIAEIPLATKQGITGIVADRAKLDPEFLAETLIAGRETLERFSQGSTFAEIRVPTLSRLQIAHPIGVDEQRRIAKILSTVDEAIEGTERLIAKHQQIKAGLMHDLFTRGLTPDGHLRPPDTECPGLYKDSPLGPIPKEWNVRQLSGLVRSDVTYGIVQAGPDIEDGIPYIRTGDMMGDALVRERLLCTTPAISDAYRRSRVETGDLVIAIRATVGKVLPVPSELDGANLTQGTARIAPSAEVDSSCLLWCLRSTRAQRAIELRTKGTTFREIALRDLRRVDLALPSDLSEQQRIAARLDSCASAIEQETRLSGKLQCQKRGLMHDLLTGEVKVSVPEADDDA